jgi:hypothetical protein
MRTLRSDTQKAALSPAASATPTRLTSLDAYRGFVIRVWDECSSRPGHRKRIMARADGEDYVLAFHALEADPGGLV